MSIIPRSLIVLLPLFCASCSSVQQAAPQPSSETNVVAFVHATVIPMDKERLIADQTVLTAGGRIVEIGPSSSVQVPKGALRVDATGRYLLPALSDMHVHLLSEAWNMMLPPDALAKAATADEAREVVDRAKAEGYDKMKVYTFIEKEPYDATIFASHGHGMDVIGHIPAKLSVEYVLEAGQKMIAHTEEVARHADGDYSPERIDYYADLMAKRGVWLTPTLVTTRAIMRVHNDFDGLMSEPENGYYHHPLQQAVWSFIANNLYQPHPAAVRQRIRDDFQKFQQPLTKAFHDKGGKLLIGTDAAPPWIR